MATTEAAGRAILETTELLEQVLLALEPSDAFLSMRVCRRWLDCVSASPAMPYHLFRYSEGLHVQNILWQGHPDRFKTGVWGRFFSTTFTQMHAFSNTGISSLDLDLPRQNKDILMPVRLCPRVSLVNSLFSATERLSQHAREHVGLVCSLDKVKHLASMLPTDPPCVLAKIIASFRQIASALSITLHVDLVTVGEGLLNLRNIMDHLLNSPR